MLPSLLSGVPVSNSTKRIEREFFLQKLNFEVFLFFFQEACHAKLIRVKPSVNFEKFQKKEKKKKDRTKERKRERKHSNKNNNSCIALHFFSPKAQDIFTKPSKKSTSVVPALAIWHGC
jgi:hypothetical protein